MAIRPRKRKRPVRSPDVVAHEELGVALGRLCIEDASIRTAVVSGFTRALREHHAGAQPRGAVVAAAELAAAGDVMAALHGVQSRPRRRKRKS
jgi:hypothetical protein